jgi:hypothetical protein
MRATCLPVWRFLILWQKKFYRTIRRHVLTKNARFHYTVSLSRSHTAHSKITEQTVLCAYRLWRNLYNSFGSLNPRTQIWTWCNIHEMHQEFSPYVTLKATTSKFGLHYYFTMSRGFSISATGSFITRWIEEVMDCILRETVTFRRTRCQVVGTNISGCHDISYCCTWGRRVVTTRELIKLCVSLWVMSGVCASFWARGLSAIQSSSVGAAIHMRVYPTLLTVTVGICGDTCVCMQQTPRKSEYVKIHGL